DATKPLAGQFSDVAASGPGSERSPRVAWNGQSFLVVWEDDRDGAKFVSAGAATLPEGTDLWGQRFDRTGVAAGPPFAGIAPCGDHRYTAVDALPSGDFLVAWVDTRKDGGGAVWPSSYFTALDAGPQHSRVYAARVTPTGTVRDPGGFQVGDSSTQLDRF